MSKNQQTETLTAIIALVRVRKILLIFGSSIILLALVAPFVFLFYISLAIGWIWMLMTYDKWKDVQGIRTITKLANIWPDN